MKIEGIQVISAPDVLAGGGGGAAARARRGGVFCRRPPPPPPCVLGLKQNFKNQRNKIITFPVG
jgi:hypothetical protein